MMGDDHQMFTLDELEIIELGLAHRAEWFAKRTKDSYRPGTVMNLAYEHMETLRLMDKVRQMRLALNESYDDNDDSEDAW